MQDDPNSDRNKRCTAIRQSLIIAVDIRRIAAGFPENVCSCPDTIVKADLLIERDLLKRSINITGIRSNEQNAGVAERFNAFACKADVWGFDSLRRRR